jgi:hypothetical protein
MKRVYLSRDVLRLDSSFLHARHRHGRRLGWLGQLLHWLRGG